MRNHEPNETLHAKPASASKATQAASWLAAWAVLCVAMFGLRFRKVWTLVGESWVGLVIGFTVLWLGGAILFLVFSQLDRIKSEGLRFAAQMLVCLLVTIAIGGVIVVITL